MNPAALPGSSLQTETPVASAVRKGLCARPKRLPPWLFYDSDGSHLFDQITRLPEYYLTRTERAILAANAAGMIAQAAGLDGAEPARLRITELGAGFADKTRLLLKAAVERQGDVLYEPVDVSASALEAARVRIGREMPGVRVAPRLMDYTHGLELEPAGDGERRLVLYIGSSIGNFEPGPAAQLLLGIRAGLEPGDTLLLGVDLRKGESTLLAAYDDAAGVTARFNLNLLARLNRELGADFDLGAFAHRAVWNRSESRIEMHLESLKAQRVRLASLGLEASFRAGERIHTENSYKYTMPMVREMLQLSGFSLDATWFDHRAWFALHLARV